MLEVRLGGPPSAVSMVWPSRALSRTAAAVSRCSRAAFRIRERLAAMRRREVCCHGRPSLERLTFRGLAAGGKMIEVVVAEDRPGGAGETGSDWERADNAASRSPAKSSPGFIVLLFGHRGLNLSRIARSFRRVPSRGNQWLRRRPSRRRITAGTGRCCRNNTRRRGEDGLWKGRGEWKAGKTSSEGEQGSNRNERFPTLPTVAWKSLTRFLLSHSPDDDDSVLRTRGDFYWALTSRGSSTLRSGKGEPAFLATW